MFHRRLEIAGAELRLLEPHHCQTVFASVDSNRAMLRRRLPWVDAAQSAADTRAFIEEQLLKLAQQTELTAGIWLNDEFAGVIGVSLAADAPTAEIGYWPAARFQSRSFGFLRVPSHAEIGYWLGARFQGKGLMTAAVRAVTAYLFEERGMRRVEIRCALENRKSRAIAERLRFALETAPPGAGCGGEAVYALAAPRTPRPAAAGR